MQSRPRGTHLPSRPENSSANVTSAVGMEETFGRLRARRQSLFTRTVIWITVLVCVAFLLATLAQAWSNSRLEQQIQAAQTSLQQLSKHHDQLKQAENYYKDPSVIESEARQQLGYIRPGEQPVVVINAGDQATPQPQPQQHHVQGQQNYWQAWWQMLFGH